MTTRDPGPTSSPTATSDTSDGSFDLGRTLRLGRRRKDLSQRGLAERSGVAVSTVARLEARRSTDVLLSTVGALFHALDLRPAGLDRATGTELITHVSETWRDAAGRHLPPHLEPRPPAGKDDTWWWGWLRYSTWSDPPQPAFTYSRSRSARDRWRRMVDPWRDYVYPGPLPARSERTNE